MFKFFILSFLAFNFATITGAEARAIVRGSTNPGFAAMGISYCVDVGGIHSDDATGVTLSCSACGLQAAPKGYGGRDWVNHTCLSGRSAGPGTLGSSVKPANLIKR